MTLPKRVLGKTGVEVSVIALGTGAFGFGKVSHETGVGIVQRAVELGVTYFDTAHYYESELMVGDGLAGSRDRVFVATKTTKRNRQTAEEDLKLSLKQLRTDYLDLWSMHCVNTIGDVDALVSRGGRSNTRWKRRRTDSSDSLASPVTPDQTCWRTRSSGSRSTP